ncbi:hypothetical protein L1887_20093 [Cichorium endivia]|nr:hypothetical protein L1887_20093 [Cichorium endivia]
MAQDNRTTASFYDEFEKNSHSMVPIQLNTHLLLKTAPTIAVIKIFKPMEIPENESTVRVLTASNLPNGIQARGLRQSCEQAEEALSQGLGKLQQTLAQSITIDIAGAGRYNTHMNCALERLEKEMSLQ